MAGESSDLRAHERVFVQATRRAEHCAPAGPENAETFRNGNGFVLKELQSLLANESIKASVLEWKGLSIGLLKHDRQTFRAICCDSQHPRIDITACHGHTFRRCQTGDDPGAAGQIQQSMSGFQVGASEKVACPWIENNW